MLSPGSTGRAWFDRLPAAARAGLWMSVSAAGYAGSAAVVKYLSATLPVFEIAFFRNLFGLLFMMPWLMRAGLSALRTRRAGMHAFRGALSAINMWCMFAAFSLAPIADVSAISFLMPVMGSLFAVVFLKERSNPRQWAAVLAGFAGALVVIRPDMAGFNPVLLLAVGAVFAGSTVAMLIKTLLRTDAPDTVVVYLFVWHVVYALIPTILVWRTPTAMAFSGRWRSAGSAQWSSGRSTAP